MRTSNGQNTSMNPHSCCPQCGAELLSEAPQGLCPQCLIKAGLPEEAGTSSQTSPGQTMAISPADLVPEAPTQLPAASSAIPQRSAFPRVRYFGDYEIVEEIAHGGMGVVYRAKQVSLNRPVALKMILAGHLARDAEVKRFHTEAEAAANLDHPNIVQIYEVGVHEGQHYFSMQFIEGNNLASRIADYGMRIADYRDAARLLAKVARAIHYAHQRGILHRDLKPANILIDAKGEPHVTDFGLAKRVNVDSDLTLSGVVMGTPHYMAPEQAQGKAKQLSTAADIYSLGAILYQLLTGHPPFEAETPLEVMRKAIEEEPKRPSALLARHSRPEGVRLLKSAIRNPQSAIDKDLETICLKCLEKDPARRYGSAEALGEDLDRWLGHEPIAARRSSALDRTVKWVKRKPAVAALTMLAVLLACLGVAGVFSQWQRAESHALREQQERERAEKNLSQLQLRRAEELFARQEAAAGVASLSAVVRRSPANRAAVERLLAALAQCAFGLPVSPPLREQYSWISMARFSPDGTKVVTASGRGLARVWDASTGRPVFDALAHTGDIPYAEFSADGRLIVTASLDGTAGIWDSLTGKRHAALLRHHAMLDSARFSLDSRYVVTASRDKTARVWRSDTGEPVTPPLTHDDAVLSAQFNPAGTRVVTASSDKTARVWDARSGGPVCSPLRHDGGVLWASFGPDGKRIVTAADKTARVWNVETGDPLTEPMPHDGFVYTATFSPDGQRILTACGDPVAKTGSARIWDAQTGRPLSAPLRHAGALRSAWFSSDGAHILTASYDGSARVWDARLGQPVSEPLTHGGWVYSAHFSPDGKWAVTASADGTAQVWDVQAGKALPVTLNHEGAVTDLLFSAGGGHLVAFAEGGGVKLWDMRTATALSNQLQHPATVHAAQIGGQGLLLVTVAADFNVRVWTNLTAPPVIHKLQPERALQSARFSQNSLRLLALCDDNVARVWETLTGRLVSQFKPKARFLRLSPDGHRVFVVDTEQRGRLWNADNGRLLNDELVRIEGGTWGEFSHDSQRILTPVHERVVRQWEVTDGRPIGAELVHDSEVTHASFSPDDNVILTVTDNQSAWVWDAHTGSLIGQPLRHQQPVVHARFSPDGLRVATVTADNTLRVWDTRTGQPLGDSLRIAGAASFATQVSTGPGVRAVEFSPDGRWLAVALGSDAVLWEIPVIAKPAPVWLPDLAEAIAGQRLDENSVLVAVPRESWLRLNAELSQTSGSEDYARWARWLCADRASRLTSPSSPITVRQRAEESRRGAEQPINRP